MTDSSSERPYPTAFAELGIAEPLLRALERMHWTEPTEIQEKIITGRLQKGFYQQVCLLDQVYAREGDRPIREYLDEAAKRLGVTLTVRRFVRVEVGQE